MIRFVELVCVVTGAIILVVFWAFFTGVVYHVVTDTSIAWYFKAFAITLYCFFLSIMVLGITEQS